MAELPDNETSWQWCGHAHHFVGASDCHYSLATFVAGGRFLVSSVGDYRPQGGDRVSLGWGDSFYETMVFATDPDSLVDGEPQVVSWSELAGNRYTTPAEANAGHVALCREFDTKEVPCTSGPDQ